jgi:hypothetical protein
MKQHKSVPHFRKCFHCFVCGIVAAASIVFVPAMSAEVVYSPANITISGNGSLSIDLNHDGITDIIIISSGRAIVCAGTGKGSSGSVYATPAQGVVASANYALALNSETSISSSSSFYSGESLMVWYSTCLWPPHMNDGAWQYVSEAYLGLEFQIDGETHYGWAELKVGPGKVGPVVTLTGYAYETIAGREITTGQTAGE